MILRFLVFLLRFLWFWWGKKESNWFCHFPKGLWQTTACLWEVQRIRGRRRCACEKSKDQLCVLSQKKLSARSSVVSVLAPAQIKCSICSVWASTEFPSGIIRWNWNDPEKISMGFLPSAMHVEVMRFKHWVIMTPLPWPIFCLRPFQGIPILLNRFCLRDSYPLFLRPF